MIIDLPLEFQNKIYGFMAGKISCFDFETWLYSESALEALLSEEEYVDLIAFPYKQDESNTHFRNQFLATIEAQKAYHYWKLKDLPFSKIDFQIENRKSEDGEECPKLIIRIDGVSFLKRVTEFEKAKNFSPAGSYSELVFYSTLKKELLGQPDDFVDEDEEKWAFLVCECGDPGCWALAGIVEIIDKDVFWHSFENMHRVDPEFEVWDYSDFCFHFDAQQYNEAIESIFTLEPK